MGGARGGYDNSALTERGILGIFYEALESKFQQVFASRIGLMIDADSEVMTHRFVGNVPQFREWVGMILTKGLNNFEIIGRSKEWEASVGISLQDWRRDKTGHLKRRIPELGEQGAVHWDELITTNIIVANPTAFDGVAFFSAAHSVGSSGTLKNILTATEVPALNVATGAQPTKTEAIQFLVGCAAYARTMKDDVGRAKFNYGARKWLVTCPSNLYPALVSAAKDLLNPTGGNNELKAFGDEFEIAMDPSLDALSSVTFYLWRTDGTSSKPVILQTEVEPYLDVLDESSEHCITKNELVYIAKSTRNAIPGEFRHAFKCVLS
jgi:hypothetical protein